MSLRAPLRVPVELRVRARFFRLAQAVGLDGLELGSAAPEEAEGPIEVAFHLPGDTQAIRCRARVHEVEIDRDHAERRAVRFLDLDESARARIEKYVEERLGLTA
jgi:hypothetical protein